MEKNKIAPDFAEAEFNRFGEMMDLDFDKSKMDSEDATSFDKLKNRLVTAIMNGSLIINDDGEAVYTPRNSKSKYKEPITFHERTGADLMTMDRGKKNHDMAKTYSIMASMCKVPISTFSGLVGIDGKICEGIFTLLMD